MKFPGFIFGSAQSQSVIADGERTVNLYVEKSRAGMVLYPTPGQRPFLAVPAVGARAGLSINNLTLAIIGNKFYELVGPNSYIERGTVVQDNNPAQLVFNGSTGNQVLASSGGNAYLYDTVTHAFTQVLTGEATQIGMLDEYFFAFNINNGKLRASTLNDGTSWPVSFALRGSQPDPWRAMIINPPDVWMLGELTGDVWYDAGLSPFPLLQRQGLALPYGIAAPFSVAIIAGSVLWLAKNKDGVGPVVMATGYGPQSISTPEVEAAIAEYQRTSIITDAEAFTFRRAGHDNYVLRFPSVPATWVYDKTIGSWHERGKWNSALGRYDLWPPRVCMQAFNQHLVGDSATGTISTLDDTVGTEADGSAIRRLRRGPMLINEQKRISINRFEVLVEAGLGTQTGQGRDPQMLFRQSSDGKTWGNERAMGAGKAGEFKKRCYVLGCGSPRMFVPEISMSDPIPWRVLDAYLNNAD